MWTVQFNLEAALQTNEAIESDVKEVIKKQPDNVPKREDDGKTQMTQIIGLMQPMLISLFFRIKLLLTSVEFNWEKVIILRLLLTPRAWRVVLACPHSISASAIISYTNMAATRHLKQSFLQSKVNFCWIWTLSWRKHQPL